MTLRVNVIRRCFAHYARSPTAQPEPSPPARRSRGRSSRPRFARHRGLLFQARGNWAPAADSYRQALATDPADAEISYRLLRVLRLLGDEAGADALALRSESANAAEDELRRLYPEIATRPDLGSRPDPALFRLLADLRERMGHPDEALAWYRLALDADPADPDSRAAVDRLSPLVDRPTGPEDS